MTLGIVWDRKYLLEGWLWIGILALRRKKVGVTVWVQRSRGIIQIKVASGGHFGLSEQVATYYIRHSWED